MKLMLRGEDRVDREDRLRQIRDVTASGAASGLAAGGLPRAWRVPGFTRPARLGRTDWLMRGFELLGQGGHQAVTLAGLCNCPGAGRAGFFEYFPDIAGFRQKMIALWEATALRPVMADQDQSVLASFLDLADEAAAGLPEDLTDSTAIERAIRDWANADLSVAAAVGRVDRHRLEELRALLLEAGLSPRRAAERAAVFYAARIGFDMLRGTTGIAAVAPMRALALAILGGKTPVMLASNVAQDC